VWAFPGDQAAASMDALVSAIRANRKALVAVNLELTDREAAGFWTVYDRYQQEINAIGDRLVDVIRDYSESFDTLTDDKAMKLIEAYLAVEVDRVAVRRNYLDAFSRTLPGRKLARLYQIENKMDAVLRYELAAAIPVVEEKSGAAQ
jgi:regulator of sigma D